MSSDATSPAAGERTGLGNDHKRAASDVPEIAQILPTKQEISPHPAAERALDRLIEHAAVFENRGCL